MFQQKEQLLEKYDLTVQAVSKGRGTVIAETDKGRVILKEYTGSVQRLEHLESVCCRLKQWDEQSEELIRDGEGNLLVTDEEEHTYLLKTCALGKECDTQNAGDVTAAAGKLASFHKALKTCSQGEEQNFKNPEHMFSNEMARHNRELRYVRNYVMKRKKKNAFEELFSGSFRRFYDQAEMVEEAYERFGETNRGGGCSLCHGDYNQHNVLMSQQGPVIINLEQMRWDEPVSDLAKFMRKVLEKNHWDRRLGFAMLSSYEKERPLEEDERYGLYLRIAYPVRFWNIANHYYNSKKAWVSGRDIDKLEKLLQEEERRQMFLGQLRDFSASGDLKGKCCTNGK